MSLIIVGGQTKDIGKTTLVCNILGAFSHLHWTAVKFTSHSHDQPIDCELLTKGIGWSIWKQTSSNQSSDTSRFLSSGAERAFLIQADGSAWNDAVLALKRKLPQSSHVIVESSRAAEFLPSDLLLVLLDSAQPDFKQSARQQLVNADAFVSKGSENDFAPELREIVDRKPAFPALKDGLDPGLKALVRSVVETRR